MRGAVLDGPFDVRFEEREDPIIIEPTDAVIRNAVTCVCRSDLWPYWGPQPIERPTPTGHEYCGFVGSFATSDNTCPHCQDGYPSSCQRREWGSTAQAPYLRVALADGNLVPAPEIPPADLFPGLLSCSNVLGTGWFAADAANVKPGATVVIVGDGAVGLPGALSARHMGAERIIVMSRYA